MKNTNLFATVARVVAAVATSVVTGATAGAFLARKPLVVRVDQRHQPYVRPSGR
jgi:hypothetical protein